MPKIKMAVRKEGPKERLQKALQRNREKINNGQKLTIADLEERLKVLEEVAFGQL
jgi:hypothetical protein